MLIAGGGNRGGAQQQRARRPPSIRVGRVDADLPAGISRRRFAHDNLSPCHHHGVVNSLRFQDGQHLVRSITFADGAKIQLHSGALQEDGVARRVQFDIAVIHQSFCLGYFPRIRQALGFAGAAP